MRLLLGVLGWELLVLPLALSTGSLPRAQLVASPLVQWCWDLPGGNCAGLNQARLTYPTLSWVQLSLLDPSWAESGWAGWVSDRRQGALLTLGSPPCPASRAGAQASSVLVTGAAPLRPERPCQAGPRPGFALGVEGGGKGSCSLWLRLHFSVWSPPQPFCLISEQGISSERRFSACVALEPQTALGCCPGAGGSQQQGIEQPRS